MPTIKKTSPVHTAIKCPHCGWEYVPCEIFLPGELTGKTDNVIKDALGKIIYEDYEEDQEPDQTEHFVCEHCNKSFVIEATTTYKTRKEDEELDFSSPYVSLLD